MRVQAGASPTTHLHPHLHATSKLGGGPALAPATRLPAWLPVPPSPPPRLPAGRRLLSSEDTVPGPRGASAKPLADAQGPGLLSGSTLAMAWESPRLGGSRPGSPRSPGLAGMEKRCRSTARGSSRGGVREGMDARKRGWGGERGWPDSCVPGFRSGLRRVAQNIRGGGGGPDAKRRHRGPAGGTLLAWEPPQLIQIRVPRY